ncbi:hypothetical protein VDGL01_09174 [Verticillium dahliae]
MLIFSRWLAPTQLDNKKSIPSASNARKMAQGAIKSSSRPAPTGKPKQTTKKQSKVNKPQKAKANSAADKLQKKYCAGLITKTEKMLGERAGHLELIGKGKKADKSEKGLNKGGSRRYG